MAVFFSLSIYRLGIGNGNFFYLSCCHYAVKLFFYGQLIPQIYYLAILIILFGMVLMVDLDASFNLWGMVLAIASAFFYACYIIGSKRNLLSPNMSTFMVCLGCTVTSFFVSFFNHSFVVPASITVWAHLFGIAIIATVIPILLLLYSLKYISSAKASILSVLEPVFVVIFGVLLLGEKIQLWSVVGMVLVLAGAVMTLFSHKINLGYLRVLSMRRENVG